MRDLRKCDWRRDLTKREETSCAPVLFGGKNSKFKGPVMCSVRRRSKKG